MSWDSKEYFAAEQRWSFLTSNVEWREETENVFIFSFFCELCKTLFFFPSERLLKKENENENNPESFWVMKKKSQRLIRLFSCSCFYWVISCFDSKFNKIRFSLHLEKLSDFLTKTKEIFLSYFIKNREEGGTQYVKILLWTVPYSLYVLNYYYHSD